MAQTGNPRVGFVIAGTMRGGTTTLSRYLAQHPRVFKRKDVHFFDNEPLWQAGTPDYAVYHAAFARAPAGRLLGDATPIYMYWERALPRIQAYNPQMKLIMLLRNPITRAYSHWNFARAEGREELPFREALAAEPERARRAAPAQLRRGDFVSRGLYTQQLARVWRFFPRVQTLVLRTDDLSRALAPLLAHVASFLSIAPFTPVQPVVAHACPYELPMREEDRRHLARIFEPEIRALERLLGWDCSDWLAEG